MDIDTEYKNQEELYRRLVNQHGHNCFKIEDTGTSYELVNKIFPITIELPTQIQKGATSNVHLSAPLAKYEGKKSEVDSDGDFRHDGLDSMLSTLKNLIQMRDFLREKKSIFLSNPDRFKNDPELTHWEKEYDRRNGYQHGYHEFERIAWYDDGPEIIYDIPTESTWDLIEIVTNFRFHPDSNWNVRPNER